ncbi:MAG: aminopeptidase P family protein [Anaerolineae bacterium]|nr:aminopeptidase P family protein [Anaerolineae bacterium]
MNTQPRLDKLRELMGTQNLGALLISQPENRRYISGFTGSAGILIVTTEQALLATDFRYYEQAPKQAPAFSLVKVSASLVKTLASEIPSLGVKRVGFESHHVTVETFEKWKEALPDIEWVPTSGLVEKLRQVKDAAELEAIKQAVRIADEAMEHIMEWIRPGVTEKEIAWELEVYMRTHGAEKLSFTTIVASGPNSSMPHAVTSDRPVQEGDPLVIDMGAVYEGYCSDLTRSFCLGHASEEYLHIWNTVLQAQLTAEQGIHGGMPANEADALARQLIDKAGYEGKFGHGLGHGVGLAIHEAPRVAQTAKGALPTGSVVTIEPGIYLPGQGGVRLEDMVVLTEDGCRVLTRSPKVPVIKAR